MLTSHKAKIFLMDAFERFYDKSELSPNSIKTWRVHLRRWEKFMGAIDVRELTNDHLADFREKQIAAGYSGASIRSNWAHLRALLRFLSSPDIERNARAIGLIDLRPYMKPVRITHRVPRRVTQDQLSRVYAYFSRATSPKRLPFPPQDYWRALTVFIYFTGLRISDCSALRWSQVNLDEKLMEFTAQKTRKTSMIPLHPVLVDHLRIIHASGQRENVFMRAHSGNDYQPMRDACKAAGVENFTFHDLRRTGASEVARVASTDLASVFLQHHQTDVTSLHYLNQYEELREAIMAMRVPAGWSAGPISRDKTITREISERKLAIKTELDGGGAPIASEFAIDGSVVYHRGHRWRTSPRIITVFSALLKSTWNEPALLSDLMPAIQTNNHRQIEGALVSIRKRLRRWWGLNLLWNPVPSIDTPEGTGWTLYCPNQVKRGWL